MPRYDLAVAGSGIGGLAAAALLTRRNKKAVLVEPADTAGGALAPVRKEGFFFSAGPTLSFGFERGGALQGLCSDLGIPQSATVLSPCYQVALPDRRVGVYQESGETLEELRREFPREIDAIARFYRDLRKTGERIARNRLSAFRARRRKAGAFLQAYRFGRELKTFLDIPSLCFFQRPAAELSLASLVTLFDTAPLHLHGGFQHLSEQLLSSVLKNGGEIRYGEARFDVSLSYGQAHGTARPAGASSEASAILINTLLTPACATLFLGVREEVIPLGMSQEVLCLPDYGRPDLLFTLSVSAPDSDTSAPRGMRAVTAAFPLLSPAKERRETLMGLISGVIPFLDRFLTTAEEHRQGPASFSLPPHAPAKRFRDAQGISLLAKTSVRNLYVLPDDPRSPLRAVSAAQTLADRLMKR